MIYLYTEEKFIKNGKKTIMRNDAFFNGNVTARDLDIKCQEWLLKIDRAVIVDVATGEIRTTYGLTDLESVSTGLKTLINVYKCIQSGLKYNICITECGVNVLEILFEIADNTGINLVMSSIEVTNLVGDFEYLINDRIKAKGTRELERKLLSLTEDSTVEITL